MSARSSAANLVQAVKDISREWEETSSFWRDVKSLEFEAKYLEELPHHVARAVGVMQELDGLLNKVRSDCE
jgi:hypothetical protein